MGLESFKLLTVPSSPITWLDTLLNPYRPEISADSARNRAVGCLSPKMHFDFSAVCLSSWTLLNFDLCNFAVGKPGRCFGLARLHMWPPPHLAKSPSPHKHPLPNWPKTSIFDFSSTISWNDHFSSNTRISSFPSKFFHNDSFVDGVGKTNRHDCYVISLKLDYPENREI